MSGDFYWMARIGPRRICAIADCTGHGVPGGFMSTLGSSFLHQVARAEELHTDQMLNQLRDAVISSLHQSESIGSSKDGMDIALYIIDERTGELEYSGANNPLVIIRRGEILQYKPDKMPIGIYLRGDQPFSRQRVQLELGDVLYTFSDGFPDQFGGPQDRKFMVKNLKRVFSEIYQMPMEAQREYLLRTRLDWQGEGPELTM